VYQKDLNLNKELVYIVYLFFRTFDTPPEPVMLVCECVGIIRGYKEISWEVAKGMMTDPNFVHMLQETNCDLITGTQFRAIRAHMKVM
jgi:dynein heavy chain